MREIVLDTETTGLKPLEGDRLVEICCLELQNRVPTGRRYHQYINPERDMPEEALKVHGLSGEFLRGHPKFAGVVENFLTFIGDSNLVIHNAEFDMSFLNAELGRLGRPLLSMSRAVDTVSLARGKRPAWEGVDSIAMDHALEERKGMGLAGISPGSSASLDALCRRFGIDNSARTLHGALLDSEILAEVYLELMGGRQSGFMDLSNTSVRRAEAGAETSWRPKPRPKPLPPRITEEEARAHREFIDKLGSDALW